jgi:ATP-dependent RNA helicase DeaD
MKFTELTLEKGILDALAAMGYTELTPIQEITLPHILAGRDLVATAETGSGKTSACGIPLVQRIDPQLKKIQALILVPTRELALQYVDEIGRIARFVNVVPFAVYGGFDMGVQRAKLQDLVHVLVATPGRLIDLLYGGWLSLSDVQTFVLDEADEMLKEGFLEDIDFIFSCLIHEHQTLLFSATMPPEIRRLAATYLRDPVHIQLNELQVAPQSLRHSFQRVQAGGRLEALQDLLAAGSLKQAIVFCNSRLSAEKLHGQLRDRVPGVEMIHGGMEQERRSSIIRRLRSRQIRVLIATDLAGRGLDFTHVSHVINYDFPRTPITYTHRTGRTGRMGREGTAITLVTPRELGAVRRLIGANRLEPIWVGGEPDGSPPAREDHRKGSSRSRGGGGNGRDRRGGSPSRPRERDRSVR